MLLHFFSVKLFRDKTFKEIDIWSDEKHNTSYYEINKTYYTPFLKKNEIWHNHRERINLTINTWQIKETVNGCFVQLPDTVKQYDMNNVLTTKITVYDDYANPLKITTSKGIDTAVVENTYTTIGTHFPAHINSTVAYTKRDDKNKAYDYTDYIYYDNGLPHFVTNQKNPQLHSFYLQTKYEYYECGALKSKTISDGMVSDGPIMRALPNPDADIVKTTSYEYDPLYRFVTKQTNPKGDFVTMQYNPFTGNIISKTNAAGLTTSYTYNNFGTETTVSASEQPTATKKAQWIDGGNAPQNAVYTVESTVEGSTAKAIEYKDALGRTLRKQTTAYDGSYVYVDYMYNDKGQLWKQSEPHTGTASRWTETQYDDLGRTAKVISPNATVEYTYDGFTTTVTNITTGESTSKTIDRSGKLIEATDTGGSITYSYNSMGKPDSIRTFDKAGTQVGEITFAYDWAGNRTRINDPDAGIITSKYNAFGQLEQQTDAKGNKSIFTYDILGRERQKTITNGTETYTYTTAYHPKFGVPESITFNDGTNTSKIEMQYDTLGRVIEKKSVIDDKEFTNTMQYDAFSRMTKERMPEGYELNYHYNAMSMLDSITDLSGKRIWRINKINTFGMTEELELGNGLMQVYEYNDTDNMLKAIHAGEAQNLLYDFNQSTGNLTKRTDSKNNIIEDFGYDNLNRLTSYGDKTVSYYDNGNINIKSDIGTYHYDADKPHAVDSITNVLDTEIANQDISYNLFNKISYISQGNNELFINYGISGQRNKTVQLNNGVTEKTKYFVGNYELEIDKNGVERHLYYIDGPTGLVAIHEKVGTDEKLHYIHADHLGSIQTVTDEQGAIEQSYHYDPWGKRTLITNNQSLNTPLFDRGFTTHEHLDLFGLINMNGRIYDYKLGRFLSPDPYIQMPDYTQNFNRYAYALNNPLVYTDPSGESILGAILISAGAILFGGTILTAVTDFFYTGFHEGGFDFTAPSQVRQDAWRDFDPTASWSQTNKAWKIDTYPS